MKSLSLERRARADHGNMRKRHSGHMCQGPGWGTSQKPCFSQAQMRLEFGLWMESHWREAEPLKPRRRPSLCHLSSCAMPYPSWPLRPMSLAKAQAILCGQVFTSFPLTVGPPISLLNGPCTQGERCVMDPALQGRKEWNHMARRGTRS